MIEVCPPRAATVELERAMTARKQRPIDDAIFFFEGLTPASSSGER